MDIKWHVPIIDVQTMLSFSTLHNYITKNYFNDGLLFQDHVLKFHNFLITFSEAK